jgi:hypothetical protein
MWVWQSAKVLSVISKPTEADKLIELVNYAKVVKAIETQNLSKKYTIAVT